MTRINTNVSSLVAQNRLQSSNADLQKSLTRLSTGLRINSGSDDPAGLLASEALRSEITGLTKAISNTQRASQIISTADSALGQVGNLLNDIKGLVNEAGNSGALSADEIAANQLQIDSSLEAINRIAQTTTFQGRKLLDGSQDFVSNIGSVASVKDSSIDQAKLGKAGQIDVSVDISAAAEQASVELSADAFNAADIDPEATSSVATKTLEVTIGADTFTVTGSADDLASLTIAQNDALAGTAAVSANTAGAITVEFDGDSNPSDVDDIIAALNGEDGIVAELTSGDGTVAAATQATVTATDSTVGLKVEGAGLEDLTVSYSTGTVADVVATFDADTNTLNIALGTDAANNDLANIETKIEALDVGGETPFTATAVDSAGDDLTGYDDLRVAAAPADATGAKVSAGLKDDLVFQLSGTDGAETFNFGVGTSLDQIKAAINLVSDSTGVKAEGTSSLSFTSDAYGSKALVNIDVINEGASGSFGSSLSATRANGKDIAASVNGVKADGNGNSFSINTSTLAVSLSVDSGSTTDFAFSITGGGATFQLGPEVNSQQQASLGIASVSTGKLGGVSGRLYELGSGQAKSLATNTTGAADIINEVISKVSKVRGRLGSFQSTTLESNLVSLSETKANLQEAESSIRDADFAQESANLTRAQILVQSGTNVLSLANQNPRNVLSLLR